MRASADELNRAYLKYNTPDTLASSNWSFYWTITSSGQANSPITINNSIVKQEPRNEIPKIKPVVNIQDKRKEIGKKWYADPKNREEHTAKVKAHSNDPTVYSERYIRELNSGILDISRVKPETIEKYYIQFVHGK